MWDLKIVKGMVFKKKIRHGKLIWELMEPPKKLLVCSMFFFFLFFLCRVAYFSGSMLILQGFLTCEELPVNSEITNMRPWDSDTWQLFMDGVAIDSGHGI